MVEKDEPLVKTKKASKNDRGNLVRVEMGDPPYTEERIQEAAAAVVDELRRQRGQK
jgi:hypothetical protein